MSYTKTTWQNGDIITAQKLNNIEEGVKTSSENSSIFIIEVEQNYNSDLGSYDLISNTTFNDMLEAKNNGKLLVLNLLNMPKEYGDQFDVYVFHSYYDYGSSSENTKFSFYNASRKSMITCDIFNTWVKS